MSNPQDPYGQQQHPQQPPPGYQQPQQQPYGGYTAPARRPLDLARLVTIGGWVVLGMYGLNYLYTLTQDDDLGPDFADRLFGGLTTLAQGIFWAGALLAIGVWLRRQDAA
jgi:hypothetical protein